MLAELSKKSVGVGNIAKKALKDEKVLGELLEGILSKNDTIRYNSFEVLMLLSEEHAIDLCSENLKNWTCGISAVFQEPSNSGMVVFN